MKRLMMQSLAFLFFLSPVWAQQYQADWESLKAHNPAPEWFQDAKVGIYFHWGVYSVPAFGNEWYPRNMHNKKGGPYQHHLKTYGDPVEFGYDRFVPLFKAEKFNAEEWADLFFKAGAKYAGPVAEHHDGFAMWASKATPWNAKDMGPKRDLTGELEKAIRKRGMRFVATFHHARNNLWLKDGKWTGHYSFVKTNFPKALEDPKRALLYGYMPRERFLDMWLLKLKEVINGYNPDLIWFDSWLHEIPDPYICQYLAYYLNHARERNQEVVITFKQEDLPQEIGVVDYEKGRANKLTDFCWLTDDTISKGSWCYTKDLKIKSVNEVVDTLVDIVSKNGCLLLNISPMADGTIPEAQKEVLLSMGQWLKVNGEGIYNTRPWRVFGEGPTRLKKGGHFLRSVEYASQDIRYTRSKDSKILFATTLDWPKKPFPLKSLKVEEAGVNSCVSLLGCDAYLDYHINESGHLVIDPAKASPTNGIAHVFKITGFKTSLHSEAPYLMDKPIVLSADKAMLEGTKLGLEKIAGDQHNIGFWDDPKEKVHWLLHIKEPGEYLIKGKFAALQPVQLKLTLGDKSVTGKVKPTGAWSQSKEFSMGKLFLKAGVHHLILGPENPQAWRAVNVWEIKLQKERKNG